MKTRIKRMGDTVIVALEGKIDYETQEPFRRDLTRILSDSQRDHASKKVVFDLENLEFVGSSGITSLIQIFKDFNDRNETRPVYCNVASEFQKVIKAFDESCAFDFKDGFNSMEDQISHTHKLIEN